MRCAVSICFFFAACDAASSDHGSLPADAAVMDLAGVPDSSERPPDGLSPPDLSPPPICFDGTRDGDESDADCGGSVCPACAGGRSCGGARDCASGFCGGSRCVGAFSAPVSYATP